MAVGDAHVFPGFLTPLLTQLFFPKSPTTFLTCFSRGERQKYARKLLENIVEKGEYDYQYLVLFPQCFSEVLFLGGRLTLQHTMPTFNDLETRSLLKTLWEKEKMLVTSIFCCSHNVFESSRKEFLLYLFYCLQFFSIWTSLKFCCLL